MHHSLSNGKRIASAITLMICFCKVAGNVEAIPSEHIKALVSLLRLMPDTQKQICADWNFLNGVLPPAYKRIAFDAVYKFILHYSHHALLSQPEWLFALPLAHFLNSASEPFQQIEHDPRSIPWEDKTFDSEKIRDLIKDKQLG